MRMKSLLWTAIAFLCTGFDIPLFGTDILPDFLGYVVLFVCFSILAAQERRFMRARALTVPLILTELALLLALAENETVLLLMSAACALLDLLMYCFLFDALAALAAGLEHTELRRPIDSAFLYAPVVVLPFLGSLLPDIDKLCRFAAAVLLLYVFNVLIRCYREVTLPVPEPEEAEAEEEEEAPEDDYEREHEEEGDGRL